MQIICSRITRYYRYNLFSCGFFTFVSLPFNWKSPFGFGSWYTILTLCRRSMVVSFFVSILLGFLNMLLETPVMTAVGPYCFYLYYNIKKFDLFVYTPCISIISIFHKPTVYLFTLYVYYLEKLGIFFLKSFLVYLL